MPARQPGPRRACCELGRRCRPESAVGFGRATGGFRSESWTGKRLRCGPGRAGRDRRARRLRLYRPAGRRPVAPSAFAGHLRWGAMSACLRSRRRGRPSRRRGRRSWSRGRRSWSRARRSRRSDVRISTRHGTRAGKMSPLLVTAEARYRRGAPGTAGRATGPGDSAGGAPKAFPCATQDAQGICVSK